MIVDIKGVGKINRPKHHFDKIVLALNHYGNNELVKKLKKGTQITKEERDILHKCIKKWENK